MIMYLNKNLRYSLQWSTITRPLDSSWKSPKFRRRTLCQTPCTSRAQGRNGPPGPVSPPSKRLRFSPMNNAKTSVTVGAIHHRISLKGEAYYVAQLCDSIFESIAFGKLAFGRNANFSKKKKVKKPSPPSSPRQPGQGCPQPFFILLTASRCKTSKSIKATNNLENISINMLLNLMFSLWLIHFAGVWGCPVFIYLSAEMDYGSLLRNGRGLFHLRQGWISKQ